VSDVDGRFLALRKWVDENYDIPRNMKGRVQMQKDSVNWWINIEGYRFPLRTPDISVYLAPTGRLHYSDPEFFTKFGDILIKCGAKHKA
jgi:hypothetical protein